MFHQMFKKMMTFKLMWQNRRWS